MRTEMVAALLLLATAATLAAQDTSTTQLPQRDTIRGFNNPQLNRADTLQGDNAILMRIHRINQMEIKAGELAQRNSSTARVKSYGQQLVRDHRSADQKITALAQRLGVTLRDQGTDTAGLQPRDRRWQQGRDSTMLPDTTNRPGWQQRVDTTDRHGAMKQHGDTMRHGHDQEAMQDHAQMQRLSMLRGTQFDAEFANVMAQGHDKAIKLLERAQAQVQNAELRQLIQSTLPTLRTHLQVAQSLGGSTAATTSTSINQ